MSRIFPLYAASALVATAFAEAETIDFTTPLAFTGGTEYTESSKDEWGSNQAFAVSVTGEGNTITGGTWESNPWRSVALTGDGYLTLVRNGQWSVAFGSNGGSTKDFSGTLHFKHGCGSPIYFGIGDGDASFKNGSLVFERTASAAIIYFSNNKTSAEVGDMSTTGENADQFTFRDKQSNATVHIGYLNKNSTFGGKFGVEGTTVYNLDKVGTGTWTLTGEVANLGTFTVTAGEVKFSGNEVAPKVTVKSGAKISGTGTLKGGVTFESGATIDTTELLTLGGSVDLTGLTYDELTSGATYTIANATDDAVVTATGLTEAQILAGWGYFLDDGKLVLKEGAKIANLSSDTTLSEDTDYSDYTVVVGENVKVDLNGYNLTLGKVTVKTGASFVNTASTKARLIGGANGADKAWLLDVSSENVVCVFEGAAITIAKAYVPAGGIGFMKTEGEQEIQPESCANGLYFLGGATLKECWVTWNADSERTFPVTIEGKGNSFCFNNQNGGTYMTAFRGTPFYGDGEIKFTSTSTCKTGYEVGKKTTGGEFTGKIIFETGENFSQIGAMYRFEYNNNNSTRRNPKTVLSLYNDREATAYYSLTTDNFSTAPQFDFSSLITEGEHPENVRLAARVNNTSVRANVIVGAEDGKGGGEFAGTFAATSSTDKACPINIEKRGSEKWTLSGTLDSEGTLKIYDGEVALTGTVEDMESITVGADGVLSGSAAIPAGVPVAFETGSTYSGALTFGAQPSVAGTVRYIPVFVNSVAQKTVFTCENPSMAGFTVEVGTIPVVPAGTEFVIAEGPEGSTFTAPATFGESIAKAGWEITAKANQLILKTTLQPPLVIDEDYTLSQDLDYSAGRVEINNGAKVDLNGFTLKVNSVAVGAASTIVNSSSSVANLEVRDGDDGLTWLWGDDSLVTIGSGVRVVFAGKPVTIPSTFTLPAAGIGFKDTDTSDDGVQILYRENCVNGLAFLGDAAVRADDTDGENYAWSNGTAFEIYVEGTNNVMTGNAECNYGWNPINLIGPFTGSGELELTTMKYGCVYSVGKKDYDKTKFSGRLTLSAGETPSSRGHRIWFEDDNNLAKAFSNGTLALTGGTYTPNYFLSSQNGSTPPTYNLGSLVTAGDNPEKVVLAPSITPASATLKVGMDGSGAGTFAGRIVKETDTDSEGNVTATKNLNLVKCGTGVWQLTQALENGGSVSVEGGELDLDGGIADAASLSVASGAKAKLGGTVACAATFASGSTLVLDADNANVPPVLEGDLDLTGVTVKVDFGEFDGKSGRKLLRVHGTITGFDAANIDTGDFKVDANKFKFIVRDEGNGYQTLHYSSTVGFVVVIR